MRVATDAEMRGRATTSAARGARRRPRALWDLAAGSPLSAPGRRGRANADAAPRSARPAHSPPGGAAGTCSRRRAPAPRGAYARAPMPEVSVAIVSWNTRDLLRRCLDSFATEAASGRCEVWVVDNASTDGSAQMVQEDFAWVQLEASSENLGFGPAI